MSQWGTQPIKPEFVDSGITAYLWMLWEKWRITAQIVVYCNLVYFEMFKTTVVKSDPGPNCQRLLCLSFQTDFKHPFCRDC